MTCIAASSSLSFDWCCAGWLMGRDHTDWLVWRQPPFVGGAFGPDALRPEHRGRRPLLQSQLATVVAASRISTAAFRRGRRTRRSQYPIVTSAASGGTAINPVLRNTWGSSSA